MMCEQATRCSQAIEECRAGHVPLSALNPFIMHEVFASVGVRIFQRLDITGALGTIAG